MVRREKSVDARAKIELRLPHIFLKELRLRNPTVMYCSMERESDFPDETLLLRLGFLRLRCREQVRAECATCGTSVHRSSPSCAVCMGEEISTARCIRCGAEKPEGRQDATAQCLSVRRYREAQIVAFGPRESVWEYRRRDGRAEVVTTRELLARYRMGYVDGSTLVRPVGVGTELAHIPIGEMTGLTLQR